MKKILLCVFLVFALLLNANAVDTSAKSAILYEINTGEILYEKNANEKRPIASTTKIMTALLVIENGNPDHIVEIKTEQVGIEGTSLYLKEGEKISVKNLLYGLMLKSGNDAAEALAAYIAGNVPDFVSMMNEKAKSLGMENTNFENPHGLPDDNHYSTAYDMALLSAYAMKNGIFKEIVSTKSYTAEGRSFVNHNKLLNMREEVDGIKTGYTKKAGRCLVSSAEKDGMRVAAVTLSDPDDWDDHVKLYDFAFENFKTVVLCEKDEKITDLPVAGYGKIEIIAKEDAIKTVDRHKNYKKQIYLPRFCYAPIKKGDKIGELHITDNGKAIEKTDLISNTEIKLPEKSGFFKKLIDKIRNG